MKTILAVLILLATSVSMAKNNVSLGLEHKSTTEGTVLNSQTSTSINPRLGFKIITPEFYDFTVETGITTNFDSKNNGTRLETDLIIPVGKKLELMTGLNMNLTSEVGLGLQVGLRYGRVFGEYLKSNEGFKSEGKSFDNIVIGMNFGF